MHHRFRSISRKLSLGLAISTIIPLLIYCFVFYAYMQDSFRAKYIEQSESSMSVSIQNINHYISTCITSAQSVYYNSDVQEALLFGDSQNFITIESSQSKQVISYMLSVYAATPDAVQIRLAAYVLKKSFLVTTKNLQRYIKELEPSEQTLLMTGNPNQVDVQPVHLITSYNHITTDLTQRENGSPQYVFTIHLPIYVLPSTKDIIGMISIDIPISFIENSCRYLSHKEEAIYVIDEENNIVFSSDTSQIGRKNVAGGTMNSKMSENSIDPILDIQNIDNQLVLSKSFGSNFLRWYMVKTTPTAVIYKDVRIQLVMLLALFGICLILAVIFNSISILRYTIPLKKATNYMDINNHGKVDILNTKLSNFVSYKRNDEIGVLLTSLENMLDSINDFTIRQYKLDIINRTTELKMLQTQINPHFIYNTLQCLATRSLKKNDKEQYNYISSLGQMMQYSMETSYPLVRLKNEVDYTNRYIQLQIMRFASNLSVQWQIAAKTTEILVPKMIMQPLVENSFKHGQLLQSDSGIIILRSVIIDKLLHIYVIDNGCPVTEEQRKNLQEKFNILRMKYNVNFDYHKYKHHIKMSDTREIADRSLDGVKEKDPMYATNNIGLSNVFLRLLLNYGSDCNMDIYNNEYNGTTVELTISYQFLWPNAEDQSKEGEDVK